MAVTINIKKNEIRVTDPSSIGVLSKSFYGVMDKGEIILFPEEALYLADIRNAKCYDDAGNLYSFNDLASLFLKHKKLMARYFTYKDWRDRGLIVRPMNELNSKYERSPIKKYPSKKITFDKYAIDGLFFEDDLISIIDEPIIGKELYDKYWIGQFASYKAEQRGNISKLDIYETLFLLNHSNYKLKNAGKKEVQKAGLKVHKNFNLMYDVYEDWRLIGFVLKTGFKFGTHFRLYFPGASPTRSNKEWIHSKHVVHIFPKSSKMIISEWARAIRVAHSVKKTFILAIPGEEEKKKEEKTKQKNASHLDFLLYHRVKGGIETPKDGQPKYLMFSLSEEESIGGQELSEAIQECADVGLQLLLAIADRETSVTYYLVKRIDLPGSKYEYYEIDWVQP
ncbi:tRNA-intron lyase [Candidatus Micrarchaeota archaeon]|nr:tRNA-intron lyase [Candidatus Micrarchaeota archaeon]